MTFVYVPPHVDSVLMYQQKDWFKKKNTFPQILSPSSGHMISTSFTSAAIRVKTEGGWLGGLNPRGQDKFSSFIFTIS